MQISPIPAQANSGPALTEQASRRPDSQTSSAQAAVSAIAVPSDAVQATDAIQSGDELKDAVKKLNETAQALSNSSALNFSIDNDVNAVVVKVVDSSTDEVIRQIPSEEAIAIAKAIDQFRGLLIKEQA
ncbi:flagellar protein FlaG [Chitinolyticbacter meiyuanensis]|uniref:flagellar protein FlaG n=1 Tax=Chitinolyticbacter meiyuanensis TaxID=682798 RepID=UPI0011E5AEA4|nr:flagellar protein FlaG [Chitinolyticbacter meiyuanensis]